MIRPAKSDDLPALCALYFEFHEFHVRGVPDHLSSSGMPDTFDSSDLCASLDKIMHADDSALFLAESSGHVVGLAEVYLRHDEPNPATVTRCYGYLRSLMVAPAFRRRGIATQLVAAAEGWAQAHGATEMRLQTWEFAGDPLPFYAPRRSSTMTAARPLDAPCQRPRAPVWPKVHVEKAVPVGPVPVGSEGAAYEEAAPSPV